MTKQTSKKPLLATIILIFWLLSLACGASLESAPTSSALSSPTSPLLTRPTAAQQQGWSTAEHPLAKMSPTLSWPITATKISPGLFYEAGSSGCPPPNTSRESGRVVRIVDGDTIVVEIGGKHYKLRYIGIDTPEENPAEYFAQQATDKNAELVDRSPVTLIKDVSETDKYGRLLRYVFVGDVFVNYTLVRLGYAFAITFPPDVACAEVFKNAQREAWQERLGLWGSDNP